MNYYYQRFNNKLKYGNIKSEYKGGIYDSKKEMRKAQELDLLVKAGEITKWEKQKRLSLEVNGVHIANYYIDFVVYYPDKTIEYLEIKSPITCTPVWKLKWKLARALLSKPNIKWTVEM